MTVSLTSFDVLNVNISAVNIPKAAEFIDDLIQSKKKACVCIAPVSTIMDCQRNPDYKSVIDQANMVTPDGMPLVWIGRLKGFSQVNRTYGPDLMEYLADVGQGKGYRHFCYGGSEETIGVLEQKLKERFPHVNLVGSYAPPYRAQAQVEEQTILDQINEAKPDILWVGLGSPKQDFWMNMNRKHLDVPVMIGVGAAFDFLSGTKPQAPRWMQRSGLEWFFRLCCEPKRLWKRYLVGNSQFVFLLLKSLVKRGRV